MPHEVIVNLIEQLKMYYNIYEKEIFKIKIEINIELERKSELGFFLKSDAEANLEAKIKLYLKSGANIDKTIKFLNNQIEECHKKFQNEIYELKDYLYHLKVLADPVIEIRIEDKNQYYKNYNDNDNDNDNDDEYQYDENKYKYYDEYLN